MSGPPDLDTWLAKPALRVVHRRESTVTAAELWQAAREVQLAETTVLGRIVRWRIPGLARSLRYDELFRQPPFLALEEGEHSLVSGLVGRIWTPRRDYPELSSPEEFENWSKGGTARVVIATWAEDRDGGSVLTAEARVEAIGAQGRLGVAAVRPVVRAFQNLVGSDGISAAVRRAERR
ncbi:MAG TPA: hypothetical protein VHV28_16155 [Solirubrobacteraceae bacterium]|nr:hypothetical protein [Solirubrobacteraceae bacterium]